MMYCSDSISMESHTPSLEFHLSSLSYLCRCMKCLFNDDQVRSVCKPLKALGIHTVSIHPGASLDHQIEG